MKHIRTVLKSVQLFLLMSVWACAPSASDEGWPEISRETKPWTRWWWHGNALTKEGITAEMEAYKRAGIGGLEITPIYGVYGEEQNFINFLAPEFMELLMHVFREAERLDIGIDMATGTGWPFGGPWVDNVDACKAIRYKVYEVKGGSALGERIMYEQEPYIRLVGNNIYKPQEGAAPTRVFDTSNTKVSDVLDPVSDNKNLQVLAIDQIQFKKPLKLVCLIGYSDNGDKIDLTSKVDSGGVLDWTAPAGQWKLYAVFEGFHGKMVERAGPGGEGNVIDHFSDSALFNYLSVFDKAFTGHDMSTLRAFFNDSYEVDDARGAADFTPALFQEFEKRRGYDLRDHLPALFGHDQEENNHRVLCDYRETLSDLLLEKFTERWRDWAHRHNALVRNQAHGAPSNILDLYAAVDIPEIEGIEPLRIKMASSSGNVSGKRLVSAEAATWLNEHFESSLGDIRQALDNFMLHGVNHIVYHGTCYSPPGEAWPGRLFYAAVHLNPRNPQWKDFHALNGYVARCQSFLQRTSADNDVLLYLPIYDRFSAPGPKMVEHFDGIGGFSGSSLEAVAQQLLESGFGFDYVSDKQLLGSVATNGTVKTQGNAVYKVIVVPACNYMPIATARKLQAFADEGVRIVFAGAVPRSVNGYHDLENAAKEFESVVRSLESMSVISNNLESSLADSKVYPEPMVRRGMQVLRKKKDNGDVVYFIKNVTGKYFEGWAPFAKAMDAATLYDPYTGRYGKARTRKSDSGTDIFIQLEVGETLIIASGSSSPEEFPYREQGSQPISLQGQWKISFESGGPVLPDPFESDSLVYWTDMDAAGYRDFSGTATYSLSFDRPEVQAGRWLLRLDSVRSSAELVLNGELLGTVIGPAYVVEFDGELLKENNVLEIKVANLMANRIAYMDRSGIFWKKFYNINFAARRRENAKNNIFDASHWTPRPSGVKGKVTLTALK